MDAPHCLRVAPTAPRSSLDAAHITQTYRLRWAIELLFRELKQSTALGRLFTAEPNATEALTYGAMTAQVLVRSLKIQAAISSDIPLESLRPLACLHVARAWARELVDALAKGSRACWHNVVERLILELVPFVLELAPPRSPPRIFLIFGAGGA